MDTLIDIDQIHSLRKQRAWSQEQLATISNLSLRTVQRIEKTGRCSLESKRALAAAFEIDATDLDFDYDRLTRRDKNAQGVKLGTLGAVAGMVCAYAGITWSLVNGEMPADVAGMSYGIVGAVCGVTCAVIGTFGRWQEKRLAG